MASDVLAKLLRNVDRFPTIPDIALRVNRELQDPEFEIDVVADLINRDPVLAGQIMKLARSPLFGVSHDEETIQRAMIRLGRKQTQNAVLAVSVMNVLPSLPEPLTLVNFWSLGLGSAMSGQQLAIDLDYEYPERAYLAGLVHALGEAYLALEYPDRYRAAIDTAQREEVPYEVALANEFEVSTASVCGGVLEHWNFQAEIVDAVKSHLSAGSSDDLLPQILFAADRICRDLRLGPQDPGHTEHAWIEEIPTDLMGRIEALGYPDITFYLMEQREFLNTVENVVRATFGS